MMMFSTWLAQRLRSPLPGREAHRRFVPNIKDADLRLAEPPMQARRSAVLVPLIETTQTDIDVVLTVRSQSLSSHRGQISFPGGRLDAGETHVDAALREAYEEIGIQPSTTVVMGSLSPLYIPPSNSAVTPIVATVDPPVTWILNPAEVTEIIQLPLHSFLSDEMFAERTGIIPHIPVSVPMWDVHPTIPLWGATAMMLHEVVVLFHEFQSEVQ